MRICTETAENAYAKADAAIVAQLREAGAIGEIHTWYKNKPAVGYPI